MMNNEDTKGVQLNDMSNIFLNFMLRVKTFEELVLSGSALLNGFKWAIQYLRRSSITDMSKLVRDIIINNDTKCTQWYIKSSCLNNFEVVQNTNKLKSCIQGLHDHINKVKGILDELEVIIDEAANALHDSDIKDEECGCHLDQPKDDDDGGKSKLAHLQKPSAIYYATSMAVIYSMLKEDFTMQERIVRSLGLDSGTASAVETYCVMWSLRPFVEQTLLAD